MGLFDSIKGTLNTPISSLFSKRNNKELHVINNTPLLDLAKFRDVDNFSDPLYIRFKIFWDFSSEYGFLADSQFENSALAYLKRIEDFNRYALLDDFIKSLKKISSEFPFLFQELEGISEILGLNPQEIAPSDTKITIRFLETIDMKLQKLVTSYRKIVFDDVRKVQVLPDNLLRFSMHIFIYPMMVYNITNDELANNPIIKKALPITLVTDNSIAVIPPPDQMNNSIYRFTECEFDWKTSGLDFVSSLTNVDQGFSKNTIAINVRYFEFDSEISNIFHYANNSVDGSIGFLMATANETASFETSLEKISGNTTGSSILNNSKTNILSNIKENISAKQKNLWDNLASNASQYIIGQGKKMLLSAADTLQATVLSSLEPKFKKLYYGNIYDDNLTINNIVGLGESLLSGNANNVISMYDRALSSINRKEYKSQVEKEKNIYPKQESSSKYNNL